jgi:hypothetical protein
MVGAGEVEERCLVLAVGLETGAHRGGHKAVQGSSEPPPSSLQPAGLHVRRPQGEGELRAPTELAAAPRPPRAPATRRSPRAWICRAQELCSQGISVRGAQAGDGEAGRQTELEEQPLDLQPEEGALLEERPLNLQPKKWVWEGPAHQRR